MGMFCLHICKCTIGMSSDHGGQKRTSDPRELELGMIVRYCVGAEDEPGSSARVASILNL